MLQLRGTDSDFPSSNTNFDLGKDDWSAPDGDFTHLVQPFGFAEGDECDLPLSDLVPSHLDFDSWFNSPFSDQETTPMASSDIPAAPKVT